MITLVCKKSIRMKQTQQELFTEGMEYVGYVSSDKFVFTTFHKEALPHNAARVNIKSCYIKEYFRNKIFKFGRW